MVQMFLTNLVREWKHEWRNLYQLGGLLAFLLSVSYLIYFFNTEISVTLWTLLYWLVYLFISFFTASRVYEFDNEQYRIYQHQLQHPFLLFVSKAFFLFLVLSLLGFVIKLTFDLFMPMPYNPFFSIVLVIIIISLGFSLLTAFISFLSSHGQNKQLLLIILSLPLCFPMLGMAFTIMSQLMGGESLSSLAKLFIPLLAMDLLAIALIILLLPLSWKN
jgi:ABC-type transport system involved in cytochrome c biogenesis permease component